MRTSPAADRRAMRSCAAQTGVGDQRREVGAERLHIARLELEPVLAVGQ